MKLVLSAVAICGAVMAGDASISIASASPAKSQAVHQTSIGATDVSARRRHHHGYRHHWRHGPRYGYAPRYYARPYAYRPYGGYYGYGPGISFGFGGPRFGFY